jgi:tellurite resistance protein TerC
MLMTGGAFPWILFHACVVVALWVDLHFAHRYEGKNGMRFALWASFLWIVVAFLFALGVAYVRGAEYAIDFTTAYLVEKSLSVDNLFVFLALFRTFNTPPSCQRRILLWGIIGAVVMRAFFIFAGLALIERFEWLLYIFAGLLLWMSYHLLQGDISEGEARFVPWLKRWLPLAPTNDQSRFFVRMNGVWRATPAFVTLIAIDIADLIFALDSIPAVLGITRDFTTAYTSNIFAILGLRALYFALSGLLVLFHYLNQGLALILAFIAVKMLLHDVVDIPNGYSLLFVGGVITASIVFSLLYPKSIPPKL